MVILRSPERLAFSDKWPGFYRRRSGEPKVKLPHEDGRIKDVIACNHPLAPASGAEQMRKAWNHGSKGAHVTGEGMAQAASDQSGVYHVGPTCSLPMMRTTFAYGLFVSERLTRETMLLLRFNDPHAPDLANQLGEKVDDAIVWLEALQPRREL